MKNRCMSTMHPSLIKQNETEVFEEVRVMGKINQLLDHYMLSADIDFQILHKDVTLASYENCMTFSHMFQYADLSNSDFKGYRVALNFIILLNGNGSFCMNGWQYFSLDGCLRNLKNMTEKFNLKMPDIDRTTQSKSKYFNMQGFNIFGLTFNTNNGNFEFRPINNKVLCHTGSFETLDQLHGNSLQLIRETLQNFFGFFQHINQNIQTSPCTVVISDDIFLENWSKINHQTNIYSLFCFGKCFPTFVHSARETDTEIEICHQRYLTFMHLQGDVNTRYRRDLSDVFFSSNKYDRLKENQIHLRSNLNALNKNTRHFFQTERKLGIELQKVHYNEKNLHRSVVATSLQLKNIFHGVTFSLYLSHLNRKKIQSLNKRLHSKQSLHQILFESSSLLDRIYEKFKLDTCHRSYEKYICQTTAPNFLQLDESLVMSYNAQVYILEDKYKFRCLDLEGRISIMHNNVFSKNASHYIGSSGKMVIPIDCIYTTRCENFFVNNTYNLDGKHCSYVILNSVYVNCRTDITFVNNKKQTFTIGQKPTPLDYEVFPICYQHGQCYKPQAIFVHGIPALPDIILDQESDSQETDTQISDTNSKLLNINKVKPHMILDQAEPYVKYFHYSLTSICVLLLIGIILILVCWHRTCLANVMNNRLQALIERTRYRQANVEEQQGAASYRNNQVLLTPPAQLPRNKSETINVPGAVRTAPGFIQTPLSSVFDISNVSHQLLAPPNSLVSTVIGTPNISGLNLSSLQGVSPIIHSDMSTTDTMSPPGPSHTVSTPKSQGSRKGSKSKLSTGHSDKKDSKSRRQSKRDLTTDLTTDQTDSSVVTTADTDHSDTSAVPASDRGIMGEGHDSISIPTQYSNGVSDMTYMEEDDDPRQS